MLEAPYESFGRAMCLGRVIAMADPLHVLRLLSEYPLLESLARQHTKATMLDGRAIEAIYKAHLASIDERALQHHERCLMRALGIEFDIKSSAAPESSRT
jgi:hypothetical protein